MFDNVRCINLIHFSLNKDNFIDKNLIKKRQKETTLLYKNHYPHPINPWSLTPPT